MMDNEETFILNDEKIDDVDKELKSIDEKLVDIGKQMIRLNKLKESLLKRKEALSDLSVLRKSKNLGNDSNYNSVDFPWHKDLITTLSNTFHLSSFRPFQLSTINATLSKKDVILIMPTGGGKSLCFQLPALIDKGFTLVVSPMLSLMEDQVMHLKLLSVKAEMISSQTSKENDSRITQMMINPSSGLKLLYVTPEKLAKSKRFMNKLQKAYELGLLSRVAVDEVHCCSEWGHDFRPDYQFLMALRGILEGIPFIGLTATATTKVILDVQKMLSMVGCIVFKSSFNRPNLYYEVRPKPSSQKECIDQLEEALKTTFKDMSGIIYTATIKDCEDLREELKKRGCRVNGYHGQLDAETRLKIHKKWLNGEYQAIIATIAFGLGIDKPDVRFVIHYSLSKSMENFYQESGRAGRDGQKANCILFYRFSDIFKLSTMVFTQKVGLKNLYSIVEYCLNGSECRRKIIASHFEEQWENTDCNNMCDNCRRRCSSKLVNIRKHRDNIYKIIHTAFGRDIKVTAQMILDIWYDKSSKKFKCADISVPTFNRELGEKIMAYLLINGYLKEDFHYTAYSTISYIKQGVKANSIDANDVISMPVPRKEEEENNGIKKRKIN